MRFIIRAFEGVFKPGPRLRRHARKAPAEQRPYLAEPPTGAVNRPRELILRRARRIKRALSRFQSRMVRANLRDSRPRSRAVPLTGASHPVFSGPHAR